MLLFKSTKYLLVLKYRGRITILKVLCVIIFIVSLKSTSRSDVNTPRPVRPYFEDRYASTAVTQMYLDILMDILTPAIQYLRYCVYYRDV